MGRGTCPCDPPATLLCDRAQPENHGPDPKKPHPAIKQDAAFAISYG